MICSVVSHGVTVMDDCVGKGAGTGTSTAQNRHQHRHCTSTSTSTSTGTSTAHAEHTPPWRAARRCYHGVPRIEKGTCPEHLRSLCEAKQAAARHPASHCRAPLARTNRCYIVCRSETPHFMQGIVAAGAVQECKWESWYEYETTWRQRHVKTSCCFAHLHSESLRFRMCIDCRRPRVRVRVQTACWVATWRARALTSTCARCVSHDSMLRPLATIPDSNHAVQDFHNPNVGSFGQTRITPVPAPQARPTASTVPAPPTARNKIGSMMFLLDLAVFCVCWFRATL